MAGVYLMTAPRVAASAQKEKLALIGGGTAVRLVRQCAARRLDRGVARQGTRPVRRRASLPRRKNGEPAALVLEAAAPDGYSGRIGLLLAVKASGELLAVRITEHRETPGLGDYIDPKKDKNKAQPWITQFNNLGFDSVPRENWHVKKDGAAFDQRAGATISARAVANASGRALAWTVEHRDKLFTCRPTAVLKTKGASHEHLHANRLERNMEAEHRTDPVARHVPVAGHEQQRGQWRRARLATVFVMTMSNLIVSALRSLIPYEIRIPVFILIIAALVTITDLALKRLPARPVSRARHLHPLIVTNCIVLARVEASPRRTR